MADEAAPDEAAPDEAAPDEAAPDEATADPAPDPVPDPVVGGPVADGAAHAAEHLLRGATDLGGYIRHQREGARLSLRKLANMAGVSNPYLSQIERGLRNPSAEILQAIARALEISSETLYVRAGLLDDVESDVGVAEAIALADELTPPQKQALLEMYHSFRRLAAMGDETPGS